MPHWIPLARDQRRLLAVASVLQITADLLWPVQAAAIAIVIAGWIGGEVDTPLVWIGAFVIAGIARAALRHRAARIAFDLGQGVVERRRRKVLDRQGLRIVSPLSSAEIAVLLTDKIPLLAPFFSRYRIAMARVRVVPLALIALVAMHSWVAALVLLVSTPLVPVFMALVGMAAKEASERQMVEIGQVNRVLVDRIAILPDMRLLGGFDRSRRDFANRVEALRLRTMAVLRIAFLSSTVLELFAAIGVAMVAVYVGFSLLGAIRFGTWGGLLQPWQGIFVLLLAPEVFQPLRDLAAAWHDKAAAEAVSDEIAHLMSGDDAPILGQGRAAVRSTSPADLDVAGAVVDLGRQRILLPDVRLKAGESLAITGPSGSGKSTLLDALAGLLPLASGVIKVAGETLEDSTADAWRARLAIMPQTIHFAEGSLRDFLDPLATGVDPGPALARAEATGIVAALPQGLESWLGETGAGVSGGEARRLALARAMLAGADVILADEPTADLDADTAGRIIAALRRAQEGGATVIVATHDPVLIAALDRQVRMPEAPA